MPNHIHGIVLHNNEPFETDDCNDNGFVDTRHALYLSQRQPQTQQPKTISQKRFQNQGKNSVSSIIGSYKSAVSKHAHRLGFDFEWQARFNDHISRNFDSFQRIKNYIINNPINWNNDKFFNQS